MPHGHCYLWNPQLVWLHVVSDALIALAYLSIPFTLVYLARKRRDIPFNGIFFSFGMFIVACGTTHVMEIWTLWTPAYWISGTVKAVTAVASIATALFLIRLVPGALAIPRAHDLQVAHEKLRSANEILEKRTGELSRTLQEREGLLREKTSLLQEVHHRVKNNLQMISSLLNMQARQIRDETARASILESQGRVHSIALLHESLYQSADLGRIDMKDYVDKLVATLRRAHGGMGSHVRFLTEVDRIYLPVGAALPCGLIVNELVTNALKHAFPDTREVGQNDIHVEMRSVGGNLELVVGDNGAGFARAVDPGNAKTMGLTLVQDLSLQLGGRADFAAADGVRCTITFPAPRAENEDPT